MQNHKCSFLYQRAEVVELLAYPKYKGKQTSLRETGHKHSFTCSRKATAYQLRKIGKILKKWVKANKGLV